LTLFQTFNSTHTHTHTHTPTSHNYALTFAVESRGYMPIRRSLLVHFLLIIINSLIIVKIAK